MALINEIKRLALEGQLTNREIADRLGTTLSYVKKAKSRLRQKGELAEYSLSDVGKKELTVKEEIVLKREQATINMLKSKLKTAYDEYSQLMKLYDEALMIQEFTNAKPYKIVASKTIRNQACPIIQFSDWHIEERIEKRITHGLNEFNPDIAERRVKTLTENTLKLIKKERQDVKIDSAMICLGGDFINNFLHEHDVQMNFMHPIEAAVFAKNLLVKTLSTIADKGGFKKIVVLCIRGNHGRLTKRMQSSNDYKMNLEAVLYYMLKQELNDSIFEFHIPESELGYVEVFGQKIRAFHGHQVNYMGGVGDITIPANKLIQKWDKTDKADWNLMHHYHSYWMPTRNTSLNGCLCGWNSYALSKGFPYEPPLQTFHLLDAKRGFTVRTPIVCS